MFFEIVGRDHNDKQQLTYNLLYICSLLSFRDNISTIKGASDHGLSEQDIDTELWGSIPTISNVSKCLHKLIILSCLSLLNPVQPGNRLYDWQSTACCNRTCSIAFSRGRCNHWHIRLDQRRYMWNFQSMSLMIRTTNILTCAESAKGIMLSLALVSFIVCLSVCLSVSNITYNVMNQLQCWLFKLGIPTMRR